MGKITFKLPLLTLSFLFICFYFDVGNIFKLTILSAFIHECGHVAMYFFYVHKLPPLTLSPAGVALHISAFNSGLSAQQVFAVTCAGPFINLIMCFLLYALALVKPSYFIYTFFTANLFVCLFNLLPLASLDGGRIILNLFGSYSGKQKFIIVSNYFICAIFVAVFVFLVTKGSSITALASFCVAVVYASALLKV